MRRLLPLLAILTALVARPVRVRRHDVPEQDVLLARELAQHPVDDRGRRLGRPGAGDLALGGERQAADARAAPAGRLADEQERRVPARVEVGAQARAPERRAGVLVVRVADRGRRQRLDQVAQRRTLRMPGSGWRE